MSGTALADWALTASSVISIQVAQNLNCPLTEANDEMAKCLRNKRLNEIMNDTVQVPEFKPRFGPMVDGSVVPNEPFHLTGVYKHLFSRYISFFFFFFYNVSFVFKLVLSRRVSEILREGYY